MYNPFKKNKEKIEKKFDLNKLNDPLAQTIDPLSKHDPLQKMNETSNPFGETHNKTNIFSQQPELGAPSTQAFQEKQSNLNFPSQSSPLSNQNESKNFEIISSKLDNLKLILEALTTKINSLEKKVDNLEKSENEKSESKKEKYSW